MRVTEHHEPPSGDPDGAVLCDADLAILAADVDRYQRYVAAVRAEYAHVPEGLFRQGRATVLRALEAMPRLYRTEAGRERWEAAARGEPGPGAQRAVGVAPRAASQAVSRCSYAAGSAFQPWVWPARGTRSRVTRSGRAAARALDGPSGT